MKVFVRDTGPGIAATDQEHIFEKFYRGGARKARSRRAEPMARAWDSL